jgi:hypothetical protein
LCRFFWLTMGLFMVMLLTLFVFSSVFLHCDAENVRAYVWVAKSCTKKVYATIGGVVYRHIAPMMYKILLLKELGNNKILN